VSKEVVSFNRKFPKTIEVFNHAAIVNKSKKREHFTWQGLHTNEGLWITSLLTRKIMQIFTTRKPKPPIFLIWKAENNEDSKERSVEEGRNSPSQESGLNRELARNNN
jgi:hypothetical protein